MQQFLNPLASAVLVVQVITRSGIPAPRWVTPAHPATSELFGVIRKNWNDTEKISMAPAQG